MKEGSLQKLLAESLRKLGYKVDVNVGCSNYTIDLAIVHPNNPAEYVLGVLCDGENYLNANTTKDREDIQPQVLKYLGWTIYKVWSIEWWEDSSKVMEGIVEAVKTAEEQNGIEVPLPEESHNELKQTDVIETIVLASQQSNQKEINKYNVCKLKFVSCNSSEDFLTYSSRNIIKEQVREVLSVESPISKNLLCKRVLNAWGISRNGTRISSHFESLFSELDINKTAHDNTIFLWKQDHDPNSFSTYRVPENDMEKRDAEDLPPEEVANAVREVLQKQISLTRQDVIKETAKVFGFTRIGGNVERAIKKGIEVAITRGYVVEDKDRIIHRD